MAKTRAQINTAADTFNVLTERLNELVSDLGSEILTANTHADGGATTGNAFVTGIFGATTLVANTIRGGSVSANNPLTMASNLNFEATRSLNHGNIVINSTAIVVGANLIFTPSQIFLGNSTVNSITNSTFYSVANSTVSANLTLADGLKIGLSVLNSTMVAVGANVAIDAGKYFVGNSTVNAFMNSTFITVGPNYINTSTINIGNSTHAAVINSTYAIFGNTDLFCIIQPGEISVGNSTVNAIINSTGITAGLQIIDNLTIGNSTINVHLNTTSVTVGANVLVNTSGYFVGNATVLAWINSSSFSTGNSVLNSSSLTLGNSTSNVVANSTSIYLGNTTVNALINSTAVLLKNQLMQGISPTTTGTSAQLMDSFLLSTYQAAEYTLTIKNLSANGFHYTKLAVLHDGGDAMITEYASLISNGTLGTFTANANSTHVRVYVTPVPASASIKSHVIRIAV